MKKRIILLIFLATLLWMFFKPQRVEKITIAESQLPINALIYVADKKGFFKDEGLEIHYRKFFTGKDALNDALAGNSDLATVFEAPVISRIYEGKDVEMVTTLHRSTKNTGLVILKNHGIQGVADLKGKNIGYPKGTNAEFFLYSLLKSQGLRQDEVNLVDITFEDIPGALRDGSVDAAATFNYYNSTKEIDRTNTGFIQSDIYTEISMLVGTSENNSLNEDKIEKLLKALLNAQHFIKGNKKEAETIVDQWLPNFERKAVESSLESSEIEMSLDNVLLGVLRREGEFMRDMGTYDKPANFRDHINTNYLRKVAPEMVTLY